MQVQTPIAGRETLLRSFFKALVKKGIAVKTGKYAISFTEDAEERPGVKAWIWLDPEVEEDKLMIRFERGLTSEELAMPLNGLKKIRVKIYTRNSATSFTVGTDGEFDITLSNVVSAEIMDCCGELSLKLDAGLTRGLVIA